MIKNSDYSLDSLFQNKEEHVLKIYEMLIKDIQTYAEPMIEVKKTSLHIVKKRAFLGVHPKKKWIDLNIVSDHPLTHEQLTKTEQISKNRYHNSIRIHHVDDIDQELLDLIKEAYQM
ncbi:DUF5655 domain-containing protein [Streptococcus hongkongensis]|nr:DNA replication protein DnaC [Streptococcus uberis]